MSSLAVWSQCGRKSGDGAETPRSQKRLSHCVDHCYVHLLSYCFSLPLKRHRMDGWFLNPVLLIQTASYLRQSAPFIFTGPWAAVSAYVNSVHCGNVSMSFLFLIPVSLGWIHWACSVGSTHSVHFLLLLMFKRNTICAFLHFHLSEVQVCVWDLESAGKWSFLDGCALETEWGQRKVSDRKLSPFLLNLIKFHLHGTKS